MIVPSIDLVNGNAVQLVGGERLAIDAGDPIPIMERFARIGEVAVIDIDAARGDGSNAQIVERLCGLGPVRVGGGIRDVDTAIMWLDRGAASVIIGTAAEPEFLASLPKDRTIVALDAYDEEVVTHGWRTKSGRNLIDRIDELAPYAGGFLVTFVEREGRMRGTDLDLAKRVVDAAGNTPVTIAGGVTTAAEIADLDRIGADAQVGMALYSGELSLADAFCAPLTSDRDDGLWPTVVTDRAGVALGLAWSDLESVGATLESGRGIYHSRTRGLWEKGATSGATQSLERITIDCDRDSLRFTVDQRPPGFCHNDTATCWGPADGFRRLEADLRRIIATRPGGSNTVKLADDPGLLAAKISEEAQELVAADSPGEVAAELADLIYFSLVRAVTAGVSLTDAEKILDQRSKLVTRRPMTRKDTP